jgi:hypothetical protein
MCKLVFMLPTAAYHPAFYCWLASEVKASWSLDGTPDDTEHGVGGPGTLCSGLKNIPMPQGSDWGCCPVSGAVYQMGHSTGVLILCSHKRSRGAYSRSRSVNPCVLAKFPSWRHTIMAT